MFYKNKYLTSFSVQSLLALIAFLITACASDPYENYDPNAHEIYGTILEKNLIPKSEAEKAYQHSDNPVLLSGGLIGAAIDIYVLPRVGGQWRSGDAYTYNVRLSNQQKIEIISQYSGFNPGDCVKIFVSSKFPLRMSSGWGCEKK